MTWGEFKTLVEKEGVTDNMLLQFIGITFTGDEILKIKLPDPMFAKGLRIYD
jgi:hypothetical protein